MCQCTRFYRIGSWVTSAFYQAGWSRCTSLVSSVLPESSLTNPNSPTPPHPETIQVASVCLLWRGFYSSYHNQLNGSSLLPSTVLYPHTGCNQGLEQLCQAEKQMNKTLMQFRTTAEPIFILTKWGAGEKKHHDLKEFWLHYKVENLSTKTFPSKKVNRASVIGSKWDISKSRTKKNVQQTTVKTFGEVVGVCF